MKKILILFAWVLVIYQAKSQTCSNCAIIVPPTGSSPNVTLSPGSTVTTGSNGITKLDPVSAASVYTIYINGGNYGQITISGFTGSYSGHIKIINNGSSRVRVTNSIANAGGKGIVINGCENFQLTGTGNSSFKYGFFVDGTNNGQHGVRCEQGSTKFTIDHVEVTKTGFAGILAKSDPSLDANCNFSYDRIRNTFVMEDVYFYDNYIHNVAGEGFYIGNSFYWGTNKKCTQTNLDVTLYPHEVHNVNVYNNILDSIGWDAIQVGCASDMNSPTVAQAKINNNSITNYAIAGANEDINAIQVGDGTSAHVYSNYIKNGSAGIYISGFGEVKVYNNLLISPGEYVVENSVEQGFNPVPLGIYFKENCNAINGSTAACSVARKYLIYDNTIINKKDLTGRGYFSIKGQLASPSVTSELNISNNILVKIGALEQTNYDISDAGSGYNINKFVYIINGSAAASKIMVGNHCRNSVAFVGPGQSTPFFGEAGVDNYRPSGYKIAGGNSGLANSKDLEFNNRATPPTVGAYEFKNPYNISITDVTASSCFSPGSTVTATFSAGSVPSGTTFNLFLSNRNGAFNDPNVSAIGTYTSSAGGTLSGITVTGTIPSDATPGNNYYLSLAVPIIGRGSNSRVFSINSTTPQTGGAFREHFETSATTTWNIASAASRPAYLSGLTLGAAVTKAAVPGPNSACSSAKLTLSSASNYHYVVSNSLPSISIDTNKAYILEAYVKVEGLENVLSATGSMEFGLTADVLNGGSVTRGWSSLQTFPFQEVPRGWFKVRKVFTGDRYYANASISKLAAFAKTTSIPTGATINVYFDNLSIVVMGGAAQSNPNDNTAYLTNLQNNFAYRSYCTTTETVNSVSVTYRNIALTWDHFNCPVSNITTGEQRKTCDENYLFSQVTGQTPGATNVVRYVYNETNSLKTLYITGKFILQPYTDFRRKTGALTFSPSSTVSSQDVSNNIYNSTAIAPSCVTRLAADDWDTGTADEAYIYETLSVFPNPFDGELRFRLDDKEGSYSAELINAMGVSVYKRSDIAAGTEYSIKDVLTPGIYILRISNGSYVKVRQVIKK